MTNPSQFPRVLARAMRTAIEERGVAVIVLPGDVALGEAPDETPAWSGTLERSTVVPSGADLDRLADMLNQAGGVTLLCGSGCADAHDEVVAFADQARCAHRACLARQTICGVGQPVRCRHDRPDRLQARAITR